MRLSASRSSYVACLIFIPQSYKNSGSHHRQMQLITIQRFVSFTCRTDAARKTIKQLSFSKLHLPNRIHVAKVPGHLNNYFTLTVGMSDQRVV